MLLMAMTIVLSVSAGVLPGSATGAEAADEPTQQQQQKTESTAPARVTETPTTAKPVMTEKQQSRLEKLGHRLEKTQQTSKVKEGKKVHHAGAMSLLIIGLVLILVGLLLFFVPGFAALASLCTSVGAVLCIIALIVYLVNEV